jgi:HSP20 family protein
MAKNGNDRNTAQGGSTQHATAGEAGQQRQGGAQSGALQGSQSRDVGQQQGGAMQERRGEQGLAAYSRNPFAMMQQLSEEMDRLFDSFFYGMPTRRPGRAFDMPSLWSPEVDVSMEGNRLRVCVDLPGVSKDNVKVDIQEGMLTIQGERQEERSEGGEQGRRRTERRYGSFCRSIALPEGVNPEQAQARMQNGVLEVTLPVTEQAKGRRLDIQG